MVLDKYKAIFITRMTKELKSLFELDGEESLIKHKEVYQLLHTIKGTSGTLDLDLLFQLVSDLMEEVEERQHDWTEPELKKFLSKLIESVMNMSIFKKKWIKF
ncbi:Hpt domain-containing protein [Bacillus sp. B1-b2]|uniref:Hpt domain-containing protein n=1 Tax=Bacillus sp. B1-b2 TaxID=2653201 RepID=UPI001D034307|nr:Hpt domain-containing protein [Bacillus sp. B1-b2]